MIRIKYEENPPEEDKSKISAPPKIREAKGESRSGGNRGFKILVGVVVLLALGFFGAQAAIKFLPEGSALSQLLSFGSVELKGEKEGRVNLALLGYPGDPTYDGPELTDTLMILSLSTQTNGRHFLLSLPRDLYVEVPSYGNTKINSVFEIGERELKDGPGTLKAVLADLLGMPVHYFLSISFAGFEKLIDELGGVTVTVEKDLYDPEYPDGKGGYTLVDIKAGTYKMDGATALKYARSRKSTSDFDRAARQQKILFALRDKAQSLNLLVSPARALALYEILKDHISTDASWREIERALELLAGIEPAQIATRVLDDSPAGLLYGTRVNEQFVLKPVGDDYSLLKTAVERMIAGEEPAELGKPAPLKVEVLNGTTITGLAAKVAAQLRTEGHTITLIGNNPTRGVTKTTVYDLTSGAKASDVAKLAAFLKGQVGTEAMSSASGAEAKVILGEDAASW